MSEKELVQSNTATEHHSESEAASKPKPGLPLDVLERLGKIEKRTRVCLEDCIPEDCFHVRYFLNVGKVIDIMRASAAESFKVRLEFYESNPGFSPEWLDRIVTETIRATLAQAPPRFSYTTSAAEIREELDAELRGILSLRVERRNLEGEVVIDRTRSVAINEDPVAQRTARRRAVVMPILKKKRWKPGRLAMMAGIGKNSVYQYLNGTRAKISAENRQALADALDLNEQELPSEPSEKFRQLLKSSTRLARLSARRQKPGRRLQQL